MLVHPRVRPGALSLILLATLGGVAGAATPVVREGHLVVWADNRHAAPTGSGATAAPDGRRGLKIYLSPHANGDYERGPEVPQRADVELIAMQADQPSLFSVARRLGPELRVRVWGLPRNAGSFAVLEVEPLEEGPGSPADPRQRARHDALGRYRQLHPGPVEIDGFRPAVRSVAIDLETRDVEVTCDLRRGVPSIWQGRTIAYRYDRRGQFVGQGQAGLKDALPAATPAGGSSLRNSTAAKAPTLD